MKTFLTSNEFVHFLKCKLTFSTGDYNVVVQRYTGRYTASVYVGSILVGTKDFSNGGAREGFAVSRLRKFLRKVLFRKFALQVIRLRMEDPNRSDVSVSIVTKKCTVANRSGRSLIFYERVKVTINDRSIQGDQRVTLRIKLGTLDVFISFPFARIIRSRAHVCAKKQPRMRRSFFGSIRFWELLRIVIIVVCIVGMLSCFQVGTIETNPGPTLRQKLDSMTFQESEKDDNYARSLCHQYRCNSKFITSPDGSEGYRVWDLTDVIDELFPTSNSQKSKLFGKRGFFQKGEDYAECVTPDGKRWCCIREYSLYRFLLTSSTQEGSGARYFKKYISFVLQRRSKISHKPIKEQLEEILTENIEREDVRKGVLLNLRNVINRYLETQAPRFGSEASATPSQAPRSGRSFTPPQNPAPRSRKLGFSKREFEIFVESDRIYGRLLNDRSEKVLIGEVKHDNIRACGCGCESLESGICRSCKNLRDRLRNLKNSMRTNFENNNENYFRSWLKSSKKHMPVGVMKLIMSKFSVTFAGKASPERQERWENFKNEMLRTEIEKSIRDGRFEKCEFLRDFITEMLQNMNRKHHFCGSDTKLFYKYLKAIGGKKVCMFVSENFFGPRISTVDEAEFLPEEKKHGVHEHALIPSDEEITCIVDSLMKCDSPEIGILSFDEIDLIKGINEVRSGEPGSSQRDLFGAHVITSYDQLLEKSGQLDDHLYIKVLEVMGTTLNGKHTYHICSIPVCKKVNTAEVLCDVVLSVERAIAREMKKRNNALDFQFKVSVSDGDSLQDKFTTFFNKRGREINHLIDYIHMVKFLRNKLLKKNGVTHYGVTFSLSYLMKKLPEFSDLYVKANDLCPTDLMNLDPVLKLISPGTIAKIKVHAESNDDEVMEALLKYVEQMRNIWLVFHNNDASFAEKKRLCREAMYYFQETNIPTATQKLVKKGLSAMVEVLSIDNLRSTTHLTSNTVELLFACTRAKQLKFTYYQYTKLRRVGLLNYFATFSRKTPFKVIRNVSEKYNCKTEFDFDLKFRKRTKEEKIGKIQKMDTASRSKYLEDFSDSQQEVIQQLIWEFKPTNKMGSIREIHRYGMPCLFCPFPGCEHKTPWRTLGTFVNHFWKFHNDEFDSYLSAASVAGTVKNLAAAKMKNRSNLGVTLDELVERNAPLRNVSFEDDGDDIGDGMPAENDYVDFEDDVTGDEEEEEEEDDDEEEEFEFPPVHEDDGDVSMLDEENETERSDGPSVRSTSRYRTRGSLKRRRETSSRGPSVTDGTPAPTRKRLKRVRQSRDEALLVVDIELTGGAGAKTDQRTIQIGAVDAHDENSRFNLYGKVQPQDCQEYVWSFIIPRKTKNRLANDRVNKYSEMELWTKFHRFLVRTCRSKQQVYLLAWNGKGVDFLILCARFEEYGLKIPENLCLIDALIFGKIFLPKTSRSCAKAMRYYGMTDPHTHCGLSDARDELGLCVKMFGDLDLLLKGCGIYVELLGNEDRGVVNKCHGSLKKDRESLEIEFKYEMPSLSYLTTDV